MSFDSQQLEQALQIRYVKLRFGLRLTRDTWLPVNKVSAIRGELRLEGIPKVWLPLLLAGEVTHIGKNTSFGFGRYRIQ